MRDLATLDPPANPSIEQIHFAQIIREFTPDLTDVIREAAPSLNRMVAEACSRSAER